MNMNDGSPLRPLRLDFEGIELVDLIPMSPISVVPDRALFERAPTMPLLRSSPCLSVTYGGVCYCTARTLSNASAHLAWHRQDNAYLLEVIEDLVYGINHGFDGHLMLDMHEHNLYLEPEEWFRRNGVILHIGMDDDFIEEQAAGEPPVPEQ